MSLSDERNNSGECSSLEESSHGGKKSANAGGVTGGVPVKQIMVEKIRVSSIV